MPVALPHTNAAKYTRNTPIIHTDQIRQLGLCWNHNCPINRMFRNLTRGGSFYRKIRQCNLFYVKLSINPFIALQLGI